MVPFPIATTLYCCMFLKAISSTIFKFYGMTRPGIEPRSPRPLANTLLTRPMCWFLLFDQIFRSELLAIFKNTLKLFWDYER